MSWLILKHLEPWFLNPHKSKTHQKVIKGGTLHVMAHICRGKNIANLGQALLQTSYKLEPVARTLVVSIGKRVGQTIITPSSSLVFSSTRDTEQPEIRAEL